MKKILIIVSLFFSLSLLSQKSECPFTVKGVIIDSSTHQPLELTNISVSGLRNKGTAANAKGEFTLENICSGPLELHISHLQCEHIHINLFLTRDTFLTIYLHHIEHEMAGAKVIGIGNKDESLSKLSVKQLELSKGQSIAELMQNIGGVTLLKTGNTVAKPIVNGLHGNRVIILNNGIRQEGQNWGMEHAPEIDAFIASEVILLKGTEALRYAADGVGGILMVRPVSVFREKAHVLKGEFNTGGNTNGRSGYLSLVLGSKLSDKLPLYWRVQGTLKQGGNIKTPGYFVANTGVTEMNYSGVLGYQFKRLKLELFHSTFYNKIGIYKGSHTGNLNDLQKAINSDTPSVNQGFTYAIDRPYQQVYHRLSKFSADWQLSAKSKLQFSLAYQQNHRQEYDRVRTTAQFQGPDFDYYINTWLGDLALIKNDFHSYNFTAGINTTYQTNSYTGRFFVPGFYNKGLGAFFIADRQFGKIKTDAALRYDYKDLRAYLWNGPKLNVQYLEFANFTYAFQVGYQHNKQLQINAIVSSAWRPPAPNELYSNGLHQGLASIEVGDSTMVPERSFHQGINVKFNNKQWTFESEVFFKYIKGYINLQPALPARITIRGAFPVFNYVQQDVTLTGLNAFIKREFVKQYFIKLNGQVLMGQNMANSQPLSQLPPFSGKLTAGKEYKKLMVQMWYQATAQQFRYSEGSDYAAPPKGYALFGLDITYELKIKNQPLRLSYSINNLLNTRYRDYMNRFRYFTDEQGFGMTLKLTMPLTITKS
ncbi:MAG: TonB-dependent receptor [Bacteroidota bacterium]